jgi:demethylmenaquinone methyltransferase/2-methoxy-6-polyprenyl-1,4-benzoquinol methylase
MLASRIPDIVRLYRKRAKRYDFLANLYYLIGFRGWAHRRRAVAALNLRRGDTVVEIGCGTGLNFSLLQEAVGPEGRIIGVDLTDAMLAQARELRGDAGQFIFPEAVDGILSTFAFCLMPDYEQVIENGARALAPGKKLVVLDVKMPDNALSPIGPFLMLLVRPFGPPALGSHAEAPEERLRRGPLPGHGVPRRGRCLRRRARLSAAPPPLQ